MWKDIKNYEGVYQVDKIGNVRRILHISQGHISEVCRGEKRTYKGYIWKYK